jgi:hypothetical protein
MRQFFWDEVSARALRKSETEPLHAVIVLSAPAFLEHQEKVEAGAVEKDPNRRVYYVRYRPVVVYRPVNPFSDTAAPPAASMATDDLENSLKRLDAKVFEAQGSEAFRKVLANLIADIGRM